MIVYLQGPRCPAWITLTAALLGEAHVSVQCSVLTHSELYVETNQLEVNQRL